MLAERLIQQRTWFGLDQEIAAVKSLLDATEDVYTPCVPSLMRLVRLIRRRLDYEPDLPRVIESAKLVFGLIRGNPYPEIRGKLAQIEHFAGTIRRADKEWAGGRAPSARKASAWFSEQVELAGMTAEDALESVLETPECWPTLAATLDPEASRRVAWKVEISLAKAELKARNHGIARDRLMAVLAGEPECVPAHECLALVYVALAEIPRAIAHLRSAVRTGDASPTAWNNLAWYLASSGTEDENDLDEALWAARRAVSIVPRATCWDTLAEVYSRRGDIPSAIAATREAIRQSPNRPTLRLRMQALCEELPPILSSALEVPFEEFSSPEDSTETLKFDDFDLSPLDSNKNDPVPDRDGRSDSSEDFDLEEADSAAEVFALEEDDVDQNAATWTGEAIPLESEEAESGEFVGDVGSAETGSGWDVEHDETPTAASPAPGGAYRGPSESPPAPERDRTWRDLFRKRPDKSVAKVTDRVQFSLTAPATLAPGGSYALDVWAYVEALREEIMARARESQGTDAIRVKTKGGIVIARGVVVAVRLEIPSLVVADPEDVIDWDGRVGNATFPVSVPGEAHPGAHAGTATFFVEHLRVSKLHFVLEVARGADTVAPVASHEVRCKLAFASYASEDRDEVLGRIQGIFKVLPDLDLFFDVHSLRSGDRWAERLHHEISRRNTLYLFWSHAASRSHWVEKEWRKAYEIRGIVGIDPIPLVSPEEVPPPPELSELLHFGDWTLAYRRGRRRSTPGTTELA